MSFPINQISLNLLEKIAEDWEWLTSTFPSIIPNKKIYEVEQEESWDPILSQCRLAALQKLQGGLIKQAFDTRKINQEQERNPRGNLQFFHRSQAFIDDIAARKIENFKKLQNPLKRIKDKYGKEPEYLNSYARVLDETIDNTLKIKEGHLDIFEPQLEYLSQLLFLRYRLAFEDLEKLNSQQLEERILEKDEQLLRRGKIVQSLPKNDSINIKTGDDIPQNLVQALFQSPRKPGEKSTTRTITITISDKVDE